MDVSSAAAEPALFRRTQLKVAHDPADYVTKQVFVTSKDGTQVGLRCGTVIRYQDTIPRQQVSRCRLHVLMYDAPQPFRMRH